MTWDEIAEILRGLGRNGDTELAHVNPEEKRMLEERGGSGTINPATGLREFSDGIGAGGGPGSADTGLGGNSLSGGMIDLSGALPDAAMGTNIGSPMGSPAGATMGSPLGGASSPQGNSGFGFGNALSLGALAIGGPAASISPVGPAVGMIGTALSGRGDNPTQEDVMGMVPGGGIAVALSKGLDAILGGLFGMQKEGLGPPAGAGTLGLDATQVAAGLGGQPPKDQMDVMAHG